MLLLHTLFFHVLILFVAVAVPIRMAMTPQTANASALVRDAMPAPASSYSVSGTVRTSDGTPVQGALVSTGWGDPDIDFATTDEQGKYALTVIAPGTYHISVSFFYNSLDPEPQTVTVPPDQESVDFTLAQHDSIRGIVKDSDGVPVAGATVSTSYMDPLSTSTLTDASGAYTLAVAAGIYHISASHPGFVSPEAQRIIVPPSRTDINFTFFVPYTIQGTVRTFDGQPVSGAIVSTAEDDPMHASAMTEVDGSYIVIVRAGTYHVGASFVGIGATKAQAVTVPASQTGVDLHMPQPYLIRGRVLDDSGQPVAGAFVGDGISNRTTTAADGSYSLSVPPGEHWIDAYSDVQFYNAYDGGIDHLLVEVPPAADGVDFVLRVRNRTIRGRVVDDHGQPVALAGVFATNPLDSSGQVVDSAADGTYTLTVPAGVYWVHVVKHFSVFDENPNRLTNFAPARAQEIDVTDGPAQAVDFVLEPVKDLHMIRGQVRDSQGGPVNAMVSAVPLAANDCTLAERVSTDAAGAYTITVKPGTYSVSVHNERLPALASQTVSVPAAAPTDFMIPQLYSISGRMTDEKGKPVAYGLAQVTSSSFSGLYSSGLSDSDGWYSAIVAAGTYTVTSYHSAFAAPSAQVVTVPSPSGDVNFILSPVAPPDQYLQGLVVDELGRPAANATVSLAEVPFSGKYVRYDGTFSQALYPGTYTVWAGGAGFVSSTPQQIQVPPSRTDLTFSVRRADQFIFGEVTDHDGNPLCAVEVEASGEGVTTSVLTNSSGRFALSVPGGTHTIRASASGYPAASQTVMVPPTATNLRLVLTETGAETASLVYLPAVVSAP